MRRRDFIAGLGAVAWPLAARAQLLDRVPRIGIISTRDENDPQAGLNYTDFRDGLSQAGWIDGRNIVIEDRRGGGDDARLSDIAADLIGKPSSVIVAIGFGAVVALKQRTSTIPIVFVNVGDPVAGGFVTSYDKPGGNITGFATERFSFAGKWLSLLKEIAPGLQNAILLYDGSTNWRGYLRTLEDAASALKVSIGGVELAGIGATERQVGSLVSMPGPGLIVMPGVQTVNNRDFIAALAIRHRLPTMYPSKFFVAGGGLASYGPDDTDLYHRVAQYVDRILRGARPGDLPVQAETKFEFVLNLKTARTLGLEIPPLVLAMANEVIE